MSLNAKQIADLFQILIKENTFSNIGGRFSYITRIDREDFLVKRKIIIIFNKNDLLLFILILKG